MLSLAIVCLAIGGWVAWNGIMLVITDEIGMPLFTLIFPDMLVSVCFVAFGVALAWFESRVLETPEERRVRDHYEQEQRAERLASYRRER